MPDAKQKSAHGHADPRRRHQSVARPHPDLLHRGLRILDPERAFRP